MNLLCLCKCLCDVLFLVANMFNSRIIIEMRARVIFDSVICAHMIVDIGNKCDLTFLTFDFDFVELGYVF